MARTVNAAGRRQARRRLDERTGILRDQVRDLAVPKSGWIRALREALGMSSKDLAARMGVTESTVVRIEANERFDSVQLRTLRRAADALGCDLVYALVPREPLEDSVQAQARKQAATFLSPVQHSMLLEAQQTNSAAMEALLAEHASDWVDRTGLWHD